MHPERHALGCQLAGRAVEIREKNVDSNPLDVAASMNHLDRIWWKQGKLAEAEPMARRGLAIREEALGPDHPDVATAASLGPFFRPNAVAVVGASRDPTGIGGRILHALVSNGFRGPIYPVNPKAAEVGGLRAYPSVRDLPERADLAVVVVPRDAVLGVVDDCAARGVRALVDHDHREALPVALEPEVPETGLEALELGPVRGAREPALDVEWRISFSGRDSDRVSGQPGAGEPAHPASAEAPGNFPGALHPALGNTRRASTRGRRTV